MGPSDLRTYMAPLRSGGQRWPLSDLGSGMALSDLKAYVGPLRPERPQTWGQRWPLRPGVRDDPSDLRAYMGPLRPGVRDGPSELRSGMGPSYLASET